MDQLRLLAEMFRDLGAWAGLAVAVQIIRVLDARIKERDGTIAALQTSRVDDEKSRTTFMIEVAKEQTTMLAELTRTRTRSAR